MNRLDHDPFEEGELGGIICPPGVNVGVLGFDTEGEKGLPWRAPRLRGSKYSMLILRWAASTPGEGGMDVECLPILRRSVSIHIITLSAKMWKYDTRAVHLWETTVEEARKQTRAFECLSQPAAPRTYVQSAPRVNQTAPKLLTVSSLA